MAINPISNFLYMIGKYNNVNKIYFFLCPTKRYLKIFHECNVSS